jgi:hypothetical protein
MIWLVYHPRSLMNLASQTQPTINSAPGVASPTLSRRTTILWLLQLVIPTIALAHVVIWRIDPFGFGRFEIKVLFFSLLWYGGCFLVLALRPGRRWIAAHTVLILVVYLMLVTALVAVELTARSAPYTEYNPRAPHITRLSPELGWSLKPGKRDIGEHGFRLPFYPRDKGPGHFRIVCVGDGNTFCMPCTWRDAWPHQLEVLLNQDAAWSRSHGVTEVLDLGVSMYGPDQSLLVLKNDGLSYSPDLVIFHLCIDDYVESSLDYFWRRDYGHKMYKPFFVLKDGRPVLGRDRTPAPTDELGNPVKPRDTILPDFQLALFPFLRTRVSNLIRGEAATEAPPKPLEPTKAQLPIHDSFRAEYMATRPLFWALIKEMHKLSSDAGAGFLVTLSPHFMNSVGDNPPWRVSSFLHEYQEDARVAGISAFDGVPEYFAEGGNDRFEVKGTGGYLNPTGNALIARTTLRWLKEKDSKGELGVKP